MLATALARLDSKNEHMINKNLTMSCVFVAALAVNSAHAQNQPDYQLIQQQIEQSQAILAASKRQLEQFLLADIPAVQIGTAENIEAIKELTAKVATMNVEVQASNSRLVKVKDQLGRTQAIYQAKQRELGAAQQQAQALQDSIRGNSEYLSKQNLDAEQSAVQIEAMNAKTLAAAAEITRLNDYISRADAEVSLRTSLAAQAVDAQGQHLAKLAVLQKELSASESVLAELKRQMMAKNRRIYLEKANWEQFDTQIAGSDTQQVQLSASIQAINNESSSLNAALVSKDQEIADAKIETANKQQQLAKLNAVQTDLGGSQNVLTELKRQMVAKNKRIDAEKANWERIDKQITARNTQQSQLGASIQLKNDEISSINAALLSKDQEIADAKIETANKRQLLTQETKQISVLKNNLRDAGREMRAAKDDLSGSADLGSKELLLKQRLMRDIADSKNGIIILKRNEIDMQAEIQQLQELMARKSNDLAPLRAEIEALRAEKAKITQEQSQQEIKIQDVNKALVDAENSFQTVANQLRLLRAEKQQLLNL
ncbi:MAG: chromosome segregation ATPase [Cryomorphaceae bacterium]|jgi:chromosome segregation ATPase